MKVVAFIPIRLNSKRVKGKNLKLLGNKPLMTYLLDTIKSVQKIDEVYVYCSSTDICQYLPEGVKLLQRSEDLDNDLTLGAEIYNSFINEIEADVYILAHTTSPFIKATTIENALTQILDNGYDSAFSAEEIKTFTWYQNKPLNYQLNDIPRTQDLEPVYIETSAFFMFNKEVWLNKKQRIGDKPYIAKVDRIEGVDIDTVQDFEFADTIVKTTSFEKE